MGSVAGKAGEEPPVFRGIGRQDGHGTRLRISAMMGMEILVTPGAETVPSANELFRDRPGMGIVTGGALPAPYRGVDAPPNGIRVVACAAPLGVPLEFGKCGIVRVMAGRALTLGYGFMKISSFPL
jgi:hypothetical protein